jgi:hypothetical protein
MAQRIEASEFGRAGIGGLLLSFLSSLVSSFQLQARRRVFVGPIALEISSALRLIALQRRHAGFVSDRRFANACFRFAGKLVKHVCAAAQSHPDLLRLPKSPLMRRFLLACEGELVTVTTRKQAVGTVQLGGPSAAINPI